MKIILKICTAFVLLMGFIACTQSTQLSQKAYKHIFEGDIKNKNGRLQANGCHHYNAIEKGFARINEQTLKTNTNGVFKAKVQIFDTKSNKWIKKVANGGYSTFYPKTWSIEKTKTEIINAYTHKIKISGGSNEYKGFSTEKIEIRMYLKDDGEIISAFPADWER